MKPNRRTIYLCRLGDVHEFGKDWPSSERLQECCQAFFGLPVPRLDVTFPSTGANPNPEPR